MDAINTNRFTMLLAVQQYLDQHSSTWTALPIVNNLKNELDTLVTEIRTRLTESGQESKGLTESKNSLKDQLGHKAARLSGALQAYAAIGGNSDLEQNARIFHNDVIKTRDAELPEKLEHLVALLDAEKANLADYGVDEAQITEFSSSIDDFRSMIGQPRQRLSDARLANREAEENVAEAVELLNDRMDKVMLMFKGDNPSFYQGYESARVIVDS